MSEFEAHKAFEEARERQEGARHGAAWVPIAAAILAVVTAIAGLAASQRSTAALFFKNEEILLTTKASDAYNEYEARSIKQHIYESLIAAGNARDPAVLSATALHERVKGAPLLLKARAFEHEAQAANDRSERLRHGFETMEIGVTFLEIAIVLVSISALATARVLTVVAVAATAAGIVIALAGLLASA
ncbi:MAG: DUF4337 family protein [Candidatus Velthaea sp.]